ncbi:MAG: hypothetical protein MK137_01530 [Rickettsiales bacterium]|nr:hypothetical protein [Rickettsiales bacterium]
MYIFHRLINIIPASIFVNGFGIGKIGQGRTIFISFLSLLFCLLSVLFLVDDLGTVNSETFYNGEAIVTIGAPIMAMSFFISVFCMLLVLIYTSQKHFVMEEIVINVVAGHCVMIAICLPVFQQSFIYAENFFNTMCTNFFACHHSVKTILATAVVLPVPFYVYGYCYDLRLWPLGALEKHLPVFVNTTLTGFITALYVSIIFYFVLVLPLKIKFPFMADYFVYTFQQSLYIFTSFAEIVINFFKSLIP